MNFEGSYVGADIYYVAEAVRNYAPLILIVA